MMSNFGCCGGNKKKESIIVTDKDSLDVILATGNVGQRYIYGGVTRVRYGYHGQGELILGVAKVDIRSRPSWFVCPNCRNDFKITDRDVFCPSCSRVSELTQIDMEKFVGRMTAVQAPVAPPPPPAKMIDLDLLSDALDEANEWMDDYPKIAEINFGRTVNKNHKKILADKNIFSLYDVRETGYDGLIAIDGIGKSVATALTEAAELEIS